MADFLCCEGCGNLGFGGGIYFLIDIHAARIAGVVFASGSTAAAAAAQMCKETGYLVNKNRNNPQVEWRVYATHKETGAEEKEELRLRLKDSLGGHQSVLIRGPAESLFQGTFLTFSLLGRLWTP
jgi:hypothetical protein